MAEGFGNQWLATNGLFGEYLVQSRSLTEDYEPVGSPASAHGIDLMKHTFNIDISSHRSALLSEEDVRTASYLIGVSRSHELAVRSHFPELVGQKLLALNRDIPDPWHAHRAVYEECAAMINTSVEDVLSKLLHQCANI